MAKRGSKAWEKQQNAKLKAAVKRHAKDVKAAEAAQAAAAKQAADDAAAREQTIKNRNAAISEGLRRRAEALRQKRENREK